MNSSTNMSKAADERKEKGKQVLNNRKTTNPISMIMDCLKFIIVATPCIGSIIYLVVNAEVDINTISMVVSVMSAIVMLYSLLVGFLGKYMYMLLDTFYTLIFCLGLVGALIIGITQPDNGIKSLWISAICLCITMLIEMIKGIVFYVQEYKKQYRAIEAKVKDINSSGTFS